MKKKKVYIRVEELPMEQRNEIVTFEKLGLSQTDRDIILGNSGDYWETVLAYKLDHKHGDKRKWTLWVIDMERHLKRRVKISFEEFKKLVQ